MKISVIVPGRLHGFDMALYFQKVGLLNELVTGYPKKYVITFGIEERLVKSLYINEIINRITNWLGLGYPLDFIACELFDYLASKFIKLDSDVYFIWSGYALRTIKNIREKNQKAKIILVRGSAHIEEQNRLLEEINFSKQSKINRNIIAKELKEYEAADYITIPSTFAYNTFIEKGFTNEKLFLNFLGVNLSEFPFSYKDTNNSKIVIGYVGTMSRRKRVDSIIDVLAKLNKEDNRFELKLIGPIDYKTFDESLLKQHEFVCYRRAVEQNKLHLIYKEIDIFVLNSIEDGFGMVLLQAMSCGCPIIASANSGGPDVIDQYKNGIVIPPSNNHELKKAFQWFYENKNLIAVMGFESRKLSENGFTWDDFGKRNISFIKQILKN